MKQRSIKFRAWSKAFEKMLQGNYDNQYKDFRFDPYGYGLGNESLEIMQFTGLLDKNGKEIYEGDIVKVDWGSMKNEYPIKELGNPFAIEFRFYGWFPFDKYLPMPEDIEVIGNIYENPELLNPSL